MHDESGDFLSNSNAEGLCLTTGHIRADIDIGDHRSRRISPEREGDHVGGTTMAQMLTIQRGTRA
jgi:hypothetical protein